MKIRVYELAHSLNMTNSDLLLKLKTLNIKASSHMSAIDTESLNELDFKNIPKFSYADDLSSKFNVDIEVVKKRYKSKKGFNQKAHLNKQKLQNLTFKFDSSVFGKALFKASLGFNFNSDLFMLENYLDVILKFLDNNEKIYEHLFFNELLKHDFSEEKELDEFINYRTRFIISEFEDFKENDIHDHLKILIQSLFIGAYSVLEYRLDEICKKISMRYDFNLKLHDISGKGITRSHKYIKKVIEIDFPDTSKSWRNIKKYNEIRNVIIHRQGVISPNNPKIDQVVGEYDGINIVDDKISLSKDFLRQVFNDIQWLLDDIEDKVAEKFYSFKN